MASSRGVISGLEERLAQRILELERAVRNAILRPVVIPVLSADPPESDPTNIWMMPDTGRIRIRHLNSAGTAYVYKEYTPVAPGSPNSGTPPPPPPTPKLTRRKTWTAQWTRSYRENGAQRTDFLDRLYYGNSGQSSFNGRTKSLIGFDYSDIDTTLTGATIKRVLLTMTNIHAYWNSGAYIYFGIHNSTSVPSTWPSIPRSKIYRAHFGKPQTKTVSLPLEFASRIRDGSGKGIALEAPNDSREFYGWAAGVGSGYTPPQLIVEYVK